MVAVLRQARPASRAGSAPRTTGVPKIKRHPKSTHANSTLATDGRHIVAFFGSEGLYAYDMTGKLLWKKDFGRLDSGFFMVPDAQWGFASSPIIHDGRVIVQADVQKGSFVAAFDVAHREGAVAHAARGRADLEHAGRRVDERPRSGHRQRLEAHRRLRPRDRQGDLAHDRRRRHPGADADRRARPGLHHQRARQDCRRSTRSSRRRPATSR